MNFIDIATPNAMSFIDMATALATNSLTLFVGTGLSRHLTNDNAPSWIELMIELTKRIDTDGKLFDYLFEKRDDGKYNCRMELMVCGQILELEYLNRERDIREEIRAILNERINERTIDKEKVQELRNFLLEHPGINIITTNYDNLLSEYVLPENRRVIINGGVIARQNSGTNIFHIHGSILKPSSIILTMDDYFRFLHEDNYSAQKLFTLLQETTVVILGYSLGDFNLNSILNKAHHSKVNSLKTSDIYYVHKDSVDKRFKRYYLHTFGIEVIDNCSISQLLKNISQVYEKVKIQIVDNAPNLRRAILGEIQYVDDAIKSRGFFNRLILRASILGIEIDDAAFQHHLLAVFNKKKQFCGEYGAWQQYTHLAEWLIYLGGILDFETSAIKDGLTNIIQFSLLNMGKDYHGYSWEAYEIWLSQWERLKPENKRFILNLIESNKQSFTLRSGVWDLQKKYGLSS